MKLVKLFEKAEQATSQKKARKCLKKYNKLIRKNLNVNDWPPPRLTPGVRGYVLNRNLNDRTAN